MNATDGGDSVSAFASLIEGLSFEFPIAIGFSLLQTV